MTALRQHGFALLLALPVLGLIAVLLWQVSGDGRMALRLAASARDRAAAAAAADGAVQDAVFRLLAGQWQPGGPDRTLAIGQAAVRVQIEDQATRFNPNHMSVASLRQLLTHIGVEPTQAQALAQSIVDWRRRGALTLSGIPKAEQYRAAGLPYLPTNQPFESVDEVALVVGMTPAVMARLRPFLSVFQTGRPVVGEGAPGAMQSEGDAPADGDRVVAIVAEARAGAALFRRRAIVRFGPAAGAAQRPFRILTWEQVPA